MLNLCKITLFLGSKMVVLRFEHKKRRGEEWKKCESSPCVSYF